MLSKYIIALLIFTSQNLLAQQITCSPKDKAAVENKLVEIDGMYDGNFGETMVIVGKTFMQTPYVAKTLEIGDTETLVVNLQGLDCTTFVENVLAFSLLLRQQEMSFDAYLKNLEIIRYKNGELVGYASRLHYFSEWIANNAEKGLLKDITGEIGGTEITKNIDFMSTHRDLYPFLTDDTNNSKIKASENYLNNQAICVLAQDKIAENEHLIQSGDIIALATSINGLDVTHTGIATREKDGRIHLLHASTGSMEVEVSKKPLADYLKNIKSNTGIMVARPL
ncbi:N-acetylmuramoyl-L-alanine amidase-like domain-containing protein [Maribacter litoralis]|uniref:N-acetylmuramoyl-L-alanine amidase-like domain-containing protein n=1 Tax=Maribacter litoralis TaxID=2059726 RepID=UPI000E30C914|nr:N-acetylmuramoyl-L-alanine amidase-like domain-containing protein [Maribacter litoralis]